jgi:hypothetical protein
MFVDFAASYFMAVHVREGLFYAAKICYVDESRSAKDVFFYIIKWFY